MKQVSIEARLSTADERLNLELLEIVTVRGHGRVGQAKLHGKMGWIYRAFVPFSLEFTPCRSRAEAVGMAVQHCIGG